MTSIKFHHKRLIQFIDHSPWYISSFRMRDIGRWTGLNSIGNWEQFMASPPTHELLPALGELVSKLSWYWIEMEGSILDRSERNLSRHTLSYAITQHSEEGRVKFSGNNQCLAYGVFQMIDWFCLWMMELLIIVSLTGISSVRSRNRNTTGKQGIDGFHDLHARILRRKRKWEHRMQRRTHQEVRELRLAKWSNLSWRHVSIQQQAHC